ncbi:DUF4350 domain-containing protein [Kribbella sp. NPDC056861]|uniref:DUF4350 domain-containing protein n=1 Tax=Kribbella sp. NPDC056861 TaxID=3154857 RepID=UPI00343EC503
MSTAIGRSGTDAWRALRLPMLITGGLVLVVLVLLIAGAARTSGPFSPDSAEPSGAKALAALLEDHGVEVTGTETFADSVDSASGTLLIGPGGSLRRADWEKIDRAGWSHVVLIRPSSRALEVLAPGVLNSSESLPEGSRFPGCDLPAAVKAGAATVSGVSYSAPDSATTCYGDGINHTVIRLETGGKIVDVVGSSRTFTNAQLAEDGNAALALNLLGTHSNLVWYLPQYESNSSSGNDKSDGPPLVPPDVRYIAWALAFAAFIVAIWRGRRLGPVVPEPLPVIVHAAETTEGRARLYRRSRARDRAAAALRESALGKLQKAHGIPRRAEPTAVVTTVAARTGRDPAMLYELLYGQPPVDDSALMFLSHELNVLTLEVRHP